MLSIHCRMNTMILDSLSFLDDNIPLAILTDIAGPPRASSSIQVLVRKLLAAFRISLVSSSLNLSFMVLLSSVLSASVLSSSDW